VRALLDPPGLPSLRRLRLSSSPWPAALWEIEPAQRLRGGVSLMLDAVPNPIAEPTPDSPLLAACRELEISNLSAVFVHAVAHEPAVRGVAKLTVRNCLGVNAAIATLARSQHLTSLRDLSVTFSRVSETDVAVLLAAPFAGRLTRLNLFCDELSDASLRLLARTDALASLRELHLTGNSLGATPDVVQELNERYGPRVIW
jgi:hypothetical protein